MRTERASAATRGTTSPTPSTWPETRWPPSASPGPQRRLEVDPGRRPASAPSVVSDSVSRETSAANPRGEISRAVRQQPLTQMLSPSTTPASGSASTSIHRRTSPPRGSSARMVPTSRTIPVNTLLASWPQHDTGIRAHGSQVVDAPGRTVREPAQRRQIGQRTGVGPEQRRGEIQHQLVDQAGLQQRPRKRRAPPRPRPR